MFIYFVVKKFFEYIIYFQLNCVKRGDEDAFTNFKYKKLNRRDLIALLESLEQENAQLQENITQLTQRTTHPDLSQLPKGTNAEI